VVQPANVDDLSEKGLVGVMMCQEIDFLRGLRGDKLDINLACGRLT